MLVQTNLSKLNLWIYVKNQQETFPVGSMKLLFNALFRFFVEEMCFA